MSLSIFLSFFLSLHKHTVCSILITDAAEGIEGRRGYPGIYIVEGMGLTFVCPRATQLGLYGTARGNDEIILRLSVKVCILFPLVMMLVCQLT